MAETRTRVAKRNRRIVDYFTRKKVRCYYLVTMATEHIISLLIAERDKLNKAIEALGGATKPVSGPTKTSVAVAPTPAPAPAKAVRKRKPLTSAQKKAHSERMKAFWAARRKKKA